ncbi:MAG: hypothetical protein AAF682_25010 [Planctomycetota bacterium]
MASAPTELPRLRLLGPDAGFECVPGGRSAELDALLERSDVETLVLVPLVSPRKVARKGLPPRDKLEQRRRSLEGDWRDAELLPADGPAIPAAYAFGLRRYRAWLVAEKLGVPEYYWACRGEAIEVHGQPFEEDGFEFRDIRRAARAGRRELVRTALELHRLPESLAAVGGSVARLRGVAAAVLAASVVAVLIGFFLDGRADRLGDPWGSWFPLVLPILLPPLAVGLYLRRHLAAGEALRELARDEVDRAWYESAPHMLAAWGITLGGVALWTAACQLAWDAFDPLSFLEDFCRNSVIALWVLTPWTYARDAGSAAGASFEAGFTALISLFVFKLTLFFADIASDALWWLARRIAFFELPLWLRQVVNVVADVGAELTVLAIFLGYTWTKAHEHFGRWATVRAAG